MLLILSVTSVQCKKLTSETAKRGDLKEQIRIRVIGFGWKDLDHPCSRNGVTYPAYNFLNLLCGESIPEQRNKNVPNVPLVVLPSRGDRQQLGKRSRGLDALDARDRENEDEFVNKYEDLRDELEDMGNTDRYEKLQPTPPEVDEYLIYYNIEQLWGYKEDDGNKVNQWFRGTVVAIKFGGKVHIKLDDTFLRPGDTRITEEKLLKSKWNKHVRGGLRINLGII